MKFLLPLAAVWLLVMLAVSCSKDDEDTMPDLPPVEALSMDFSDFSELPDTTDLKSTEGYWNFAYAYTSVSFWNALTVVTMAVPVASYLESLNQTPVYLGDNSWEWSYTVTVLHLEYTARLVTTRLNNEEFKVEMFISLTGVFEDFKWFEGTVRYDRTNASWTMYQGPDHSGSAWLNIEWNKDWEADTSNIRYTYVMTGDTEYGSYIEYGITDDTDYDAYYTVSGSQSTVEIKWNRTSKAGRVKSEAVFGDTGWHCWDESFMNVTCE